MRAPPRWFQVLAGVLIACILGLYGVFQYFSSSRMVLKHALNIHSIPKSVTNLKMGSDVWTDEVRCFYLTIAPDEFPKLLMGRDYRVLTNAFPFERETMHISPAAKVSGHVSYEWETTAAKCEVYPDDTREHAIIIFFAD